MPAQRHKKRLQAGLKKARVLNGLRERLRSERPVNRRRTLAVEGGDNTAAARQAAVQLALGEVERLHGPAVSLVADLERAIARLGAQQQDAR